MQNETAGTAFSKYGNVYRSFAPELLASLTCHDKQIPAQQTLSQFLCFGKEAFIEVLSGIGVLLVSPDPQTQAIEEFGMNKRIRIKPGVYFSFVSTTPELSLHLYTHPNDQMDVITLSAPYEYHPVLPHIRLQNILGYYYRNRAPGYHFQGEQHQFFELTYVDTGTLYTEVDGIPYTLGEKELIIYTPGQFHSQHTENQAAAYVTIMFSMENTSPNLPTDWYSVLSSRVFPYSKKIYKLVKALVQESASNAPYTDSLMHCLLTEIIVRLLQSVYTAPDAQTTSVLRENYQDELLDQILAYIESKIYEPLTVAHICQYFSLSRSTLQLLFRNSMNQSPKKYISDLKLERSCQLLRENRYTVSEISLKLGYSSIHYFSNAFNQKYGMPPSEYAKRIY